MSKLLRMEFIFNRNYVFVMLLIFFAYFAYMVASISSPRLLLVMISLMVGLAMPVGLVGREDKFKTSSLVCSLPVRRAKIVCAKYIATWIMSGMFISYVLILAAVFPFAKVSIADILNLKSLLICLAFISLFYCVIIPFTIRFGIAGIIVFLVGTQVLGIVMLLLTRFLGPNGNPLRFIIGNLENGIRFVMNHPASPGFLLILFAVILFLNAASYLVSRLLYSRREF